MFLTRCSSILRSIRKGKFQRKDLIRSSTKGLLILRLDENPSSNQFSSLVISQSDRIVSLLLLSKSEDPLDTVKIICLNSLIDEDEQTDAKKKLHLLIEQILFVDNLADLEKSLSAKQRFVLLTDCQFSQSEILSMKRLQFIPVVRIRQRNLFKVFSPKKERQSKESLTMAFSIKIDAIDRRWN